MTTTVVVPTPLVNRVRERATASGTTPAENTVAPLPAIAAAQPPDAAYTAISKIVTTPAAGATDADLVGAQGTATTAAQVNGSATGWIVEAGADDSTYAERRR